MSQQGDRNIVKTLSDERLAKLANDGGSYWQEAQEELKDRQAKRIVKRMEEHKDRQAKGIVEPMEEVEDRQREQGPTISPDAQYIAQRASEDAQKASGRIVTHMWIIFVLLPVVAYLLLYIVMHP